MSEREQIYRITNSGKVIPISDLVRCENCVYAELDCVSYYCPKRMEYHGKDWYCADGKRKDDNH